MVSQMRTNILWAKETELVSGRGNQRTQHQFYHLIAVRSGTGVIYCNDQELLLSGGQCVLISPSIVHELPKEKHNLMSFYEVKFEVHDPYLDNILSQGSPVFELTPYVETAFLYIISNCNRVDLQSRINVDYVLSSMLLVLFTPSSSIGETSRYINHSAYNQNVKRMICYLEEMYDEKFLLSNMAQALGLNASYMSTSFTKQTGYSIIDYLNYVRIRNSMKSLYYGDVDIANSALEVGYTSVAHFNRVFRKIVGTSPTAFRKCFSAEQWCTEEKPIGAELFESLVELRLATSMADAFDTLSLLGEMAEKHRKKGSSPLSDSDEDMDILENP